MNTKGISMFSAIMVGSKNIINDGRYGDVLKKYHNPEFVNGLGRDSFDKRRAIEMGRGRRLAEAMCEQGATPEEFERLVLYSYICIDALKYSLNFEQACTDLKIKDLRAKYKTDKTL